MKKLYQASIYTLVHNEQPKTMQADQDDSYSFSIYCLVCYWHLDSSFLDFPSVHLAIRITYSKSLSYHNEQIY